MANVKKKPYKTAQDRIADKLVAQHERREARLQEKYNNMEYNAADDAQLKRIHREQVRAQGDCFDVTQYNKDPRRRKSFPEFCRDFIGQTYGAMAQDLLELHNSPNPNDKIQFLKFMMEMGKAGYPASLNLDGDAAKSAQKDIYAQLEQMSTTGIAPAIGKEAESLQEKEEDNEPQEEQQEEEPQEESREENYEVEELETEVLDNSGFDDKFSADYPPIGIGDTRDLLSQYESFSQE